jgi:two-component system, NarL family, response regulator LiaR
MPAKGEPDMTDAQGKIKVLIVDDHQVVRQGLRGFLEMIEDMTVIGEAGDGVTALEAVRKLEPDVVLMDLVMPKMDGITAIRQIKALGGLTRVIALTSFSDDNQVFPAIQAGASSYLLKDVSPDELVEAIRAVHRGEARLHPNIARKLMEQVASQAGGPNRMQEDNLTERELEIACLVAKGHSNGEIARALVISDKTVKTHVSNILGKLHLEDRTQLAIYAFKKGLVNPQDL